MFVLKKIDTFNLRGKLQTFGIFFNNCIWKTVRRQLK